MDGTSGQQAHENNGIAAGVWGRPRPAHVRQNLVGISKLPQASLRGGRLARNSEPLLPRHIIEVRRISAGWYTGLVEVHPLVPNLERRVAQERPTAGQRRNGLPYHQSRKGIGGVAWGIFPCEQRQGRKLRGLAREQGKSPPPLPHRVRDRAGTTATPRRTGVLPTLLLLISQHEAVGGLLPAQNTPQ